MSPRQFKAALRRLLGLTVAPPVRVSLNRPEANRFRPRVERMEDRTVPTPVVTAAALSDAHEGGSGSFRLTRTETTGTLFVSLGLSGSATSGSDYSNPMGAMFPGGQATVDVNIGAFDDSTSEPTETVVLTINSGSGYTVGTPSGATINILDNDPQVVTVAKVSDAIEGGSGTFRFTRTGDLSAVLNFTYSVSGSSTASGSDYALAAGPLAFSAGAATSDLPVQAVADNLVEGDETLIVSVTSGTGYTVGSPSSATVTIHDDPPVIAVSATDTAEGSATGGFSFTRSGGDLSSSLTATYTVGGTATSGTDYAALSGSVTFAADEDRVEVPVEAYGDNVADDGETVTATIDDGGTDYDTDPAAGETTVTIADQALTVSVVALNDGAEASTPVDGKFRFTRSGDLSSSLTVTYTVGGTATSGSDYTALSGSVTFGSNVNTVDVTVYVIDDLIAEPTETVAVTLDESEDYLLGNGSDTIFIKDNDRLPVYWISTSSTDWDTDANWSTNAVPVDGDDVYFVYTGTADCLNAGDGVSSLYGLHISGGYSGTVALANALSVETYEQTTATLDQPSGYDLTVTAVMLWSGGTLDSTGSGANVNLSGGAGRIDPPDTGSMSTSSTFRVIGGALATFLPGTLNFAAGGGMQIAGDAKLRVLVGPNVAVTWTKPNATGAKIDIAWDGTLEVSSADKSRVGTCETDLPISNAGTFSVTQTIHLVVNGHVDGASGPSILQTNGVMNWWTGSNIVTQFGMSLYSGTLQFNVLQANKIAILVGSLTVGSASTTPIVTFVGVSPGSFQVQGDVVWTGGSYQPRVNWSTPRSNDSWVATGKFVVTGDDIIEPNAPSGTVTSGNTWDVLLAQGGFFGTAPPTLPAGMVADYELVILIATIPGKLAAATFNIRRK
jgi:hypothetical protein